MKTVTVTLESVSPYSQSKYIDQKRPETKGQHEWEVEIWRERMHVGEDGYVFMPPQGFSKTVQSAAKYIGMRIPGKGKSTFTKHFLAGLMVMEGITLPVKKMDVAHEWFHVSADGTPGGRKRVEKCFSLFPRWKGEIVYIIKDETILQDIPDLGISALEYHIRQAGDLVGVGRFRPEHGGFYGRFKIAEMGHPQDYR